MHIFKWRWVLCPIILLSCTNSRAQSPNNNKLWYKKPAAVWTEALPLGNGRLGAMVFGRTNEELIQLNEGSLWTGGPVRTNVNPGAYSNLQIVRDALLKEQDYEKAYEYTKKMQGYYSESYLPMGDLFIHQSFRDTAITDYYRDLNIANATATTSFVADGTTFTREVFVSAPDQVIVVRLSASKPHQLHFTVGLNSQLALRKAIRDGRVLECRGKAPAHIQPNYIQSKNPIEYTDTAGCRGMRFEMQLQAVAKDGKVTTDTAGVHVSDATEVLLIIAGATSFNGFDKCPDSQGKDEHALATAALGKAVKKSWTALRTDHINDYRKYFDRVHFTLASPAHNENAAKPTDERLLGYTEGAVDPSFETLYFQYGRYLLISCSRPGSVPANLQGIWNKEMRPPWSANYTTNINVQMNYWPAETLNMTEMHQPLLEFVKAVAKTGAVTSREFYHTRGWALHHNSDIWALSNPVGDIGHGDPMWANWTMGSPWLSQHLWTHYAFTKDKQFLRETAYPLMKGAADFCIDWLVEDKNGFLVTAPSVSPENRYIDDNGKHGSVSVATTMDMEIIWDLFTNLIEASRELGIDADYRAMLEAKKSKLYPLHIGSKGNLQEWYRDWEDEDPHHRHVSHLFGLYPGREISPVRTPDFAAASKKTLELRGDAGTGWSLAWKINFWARLLDGNHAYKMVHDLLHLTGQTGTQYANGGGSYVNLFDAHPPFQIDGNFGGVAGMGEMLLQSQNDEMAILPALPDAWAEGTVSGLKARGNFEVGIEWKNKQPNRISIKSLAGSHCVVRTAVPVKVNGIAASAVKDAFGYTIQFNTEKGKTYELVPR